MIRANSFLRLTVATLGLLACFQFIFPLSVEAQSTTPIVIEGNGISQPESMAYDRVDDVYLVSNINASSPNSKGFISRISPEGKILTLKWIDGANPNTPLQAPSGIYIQGDTLYVVDILSVKLFERATGKFKKELKVPGAVSLNDEVVAPDGTVYVGDLGLAYGANGFQPSGSDAVYKITPDGKVTLLVKDTQLGYPNGLAILPSGALVAVSYNNSAEYYTVSDKGKQNPQKLVGSGGQFDGIVALPDGSVFISSWADKTVYLVSADGKSSPIITGVESPADLGYDTKRGRILLPQLNLSKLTIYPLDTAPSAAPNTGVGGLSEPNFGTDWSLFCLLLIGVLISLGWLAYRHKTRSR